MPQSEMSESDEVFDEVIVGGGSAGCVLANRLSTDPARRVLLVEAGVDTLPGNVPHEILDSYPMPLFFGDQYIWPGLKATTAHEPGDRSHQRAYEQARVMGGGSSINVQAANRGLPRDYDEWAELGAELDEAKQLTAALQAQIVPAQVAMAGERCRWCVACGRGLASKGHYPPTFRPLFGGVPVRVRRLLVCPCQGPGEAKSFAALDLGKDAVAPELAYVTAKFAALAPFGKVATLLSELLPISGAQNAGTVRNRTLRVGEEVVPQRPVDRAGPPAAQPAGPVVVGLDGGYVRSRHRPERHFEVVAGKVIDAQGAQHRFAFARNGQATASEAFRQALAAAGVGADTPATVLCDGDAGLWRLQREALPGATIVLDWWHAAVRFEHALQAARGLGAGTADTSLAHDAVRNLDRAK